MSPEPGSERYEALRPMARPRYGLCGESGRCAQPAPRKVGATGVYAGRPNPKTGGNEASRRNDESFDLFEG
jgi:hypothetical protein